MKILYLTHRFPWPPNRGDKIRSYNILKYLSQFHQVALLSFKEKEDLNSNVVLNEMCALVETVPLNLSLSKIKGGLKIFLKQSISVETFKSKAFSEKYESLLNSFKPDAVIADSSAMAFYPYQKQTPFYTDFMDVDSEKWRQYAALSRGPIGWVYQMESKHLADWEKLIAKKAKSTFVVSDAEKNKLLRLEPTADVQALPSGIDLDQFFPTKEKPQLNQMIFTGVLDYEPNKDAMLWFCQKIWPQVLAQKPEATFKIVGKNPPKSIQSLASLKGVEVIANVPKVQPYLSQSEICVLPLRYSIGVQNKLLEAMAMGKPVVALPGAVAGVPAEIQEAVVVEKEEKLAQAIVTLLKDPEKKKALQLKGPELMKKFCDWNKNLLPLKTLFPEI